MPPLFSPRSAILSVLLFSFIVTAELFICLPQNKQSSCCCCCCCCHWTHERHRFLCAQGYLFIYLFIFKKEQEMKKRYRLNRDRGF